MAADGIARPVVNDFPADFVRLFQHHIGVVAEVVQAETFAAHPVKNALTVAAVQPAGVVFGQLGQHGRQAACIVFHVL